MGETTVGDRLEASAKERGWTLADVAKQLGVSYEAVRKWRAGVTAPNRSRAAQIAKLFGKSVEWVMFGVDEAGASEPMRGLKLSAAEERLVLAYRSLLKTDQEEALARLEKRAAEMRELVTRLTSERFVGPERLSRKPRAA